MRSMECLVFEVTPVAPDEEAQVVNTVVRFAWDDVVRVARAGDGIVLDLGNLGTDPCRLAEVVGRRVRVMHRRAELPWLTVNPDGEDG